LNKVENEYYDGVVHPEKPNEIWINIGTEDGDLAQLTMGHGEMSKDGFWESYCVFAMNSEKEVDTLIAMLEDAKSLMTQYRKEIWDED
jgi:hypothetical protein